MSPAITAGGVLMPPSIAIVETGELPAELEARFGDYVAIVQRWLEPALPEVRFAAVRPVRGEPLGEVTAHQGYVLTGSRHGAYDPLPWIAPLEAFIRAAATARVPVFGICFGHQVMAQAHGARVRKVDRGWGCGAQRYHVDGLAAQASVHVFHQDQVLDVPASAQLLGGNDFCPVGALRYGDSALSVQFHPEFETDFITALLRARAGVAVPHEVVDAAMRSLADRPDNAAVAQWAAAFFRRHLAAEQPVAQACVAP